MFEINLVPDVKEQLLKKQKLRNLIIFLSIVIAGGAAGVVAILGTIVAGQSLAIAGKNEEIQCRSTGSGEGVDCDERRYGTAVMRIANLNEYLTIQDQMSKISILNDNKLLLSRIFGLLDVILPVGDDEVWISELAVNLPTTTLNFDAYGDSASNIDYRALEVFKNISRLSYYDHGRYMRFDNETGGFVAIPTTCITEVLRDGVVYGIYSKGAPGCEAPMLSRDQRVNMGITEELDEETEENTIEFIEIRRAYRTWAERMEAYENANEDGVRYYFESTCISYTDDGRIDEAATRLECPLLTEEVMIRESSNARNSDGLLVLRFSATVSVNREVFRFANKHMRVIGPTRQNVTDSYTQIRSMFAETPTDCAPDDRECLSAGGGS
jgi:hypothetical protein